MNGRFRSSISGFNREDVLNYVKQLSEDKQRLENEIAGIGFELDENASRISDMEQLLCDCAEIIKLFDSKYREINAQLEKHSGELDRISADFAKFHDIYGKKLDKICKGFGDARKTVSAATDELEELLERIEELVPSK